jgi:hypothetical protein
MTTDNGQFFVCYFTAQCLTACTTELCRESTLSACTKIEESPGFESRSLLTMLEQEEAELPLTAVAAVVPARRRGAPWHGPAGPQPRD